MKPLSSVATTEIVMGPSVSVPSSGERSPMTGGKMSGVGVGVGLGEGSGVGESLGLAVGDMVIVGDGLTVGENVEVGDGLPLGKALGVGRGDVSKKVAAVSRNSEADSNAWTGAAPGGIIRKPARATRKTRRK